MDPDSDRRLLVALIMAAVVSELGIFVMPLLVGGLGAAYGVAEGHVGYVVTAQLASLSLVSLGLAPLAHRLDRRMLGVGGIAVLVAGNLLSAAGAGFTHLVVARAFTGFGEGALQAVMAATAAGTRAPDRTFSIITLGIVVMSVSVFLGLPPLIDGRDPRAVFVLMGLLAALMLPVMLALPRRAPAATVAAGGASPRVWSPLPVAALLGLMLFSIAGNVAWFYVERIGHHLGLSMAQSGRALAIASVVSLAGPLLAHQLSSRFGRTMPLVAAYAVVGGGSLCLTLTDSGAVFTLSISLASAALMFGMPCHMGLLSVMDPAGRLAAAARGFMAVGITLSPAIAGSLVLLDGAYARIGIIALAAAAAGLALVMPAVTRADRIARR
jgi:predicted MFS family arabinose efflux permease